MASLKILELNMWAIQTTKYTLAALLASMVIGCATRPESISASFVSHEKYMGQSCVELSLSLSDVRSQLTKFSSMQDTKANVDAATVFFVLIPASKLSGDHAGDVAKYKGEVEAVETALIKTGCKRAGSIS
ncbi:MAG: hypothetical protein Q7U05_06980 [Polaromonas sp.]|nr:hypothetical protein [Polaromonas sp.]